MHRLMRNTHLILGLVFFLVLAVYLISSVRVAHRSWFSAKPTVTETEIPVDPQEAGSPRELALALMNTHDLRGDLFQVRSNADGYHLAIRRPGTRYDIDYRPGEAEAKLRTSREGFVGMMMSLHVAAGLRHGYWLTNLWGVFVLLVSVGLFLIGGTGIYLWFKTYEERLIGSILLAIGLIYAFTTLYLTRQLG